MSAGAALRTSSGMCPTVDVKQFVNGRTGVESVYPVVADVTKLEDIERMGGEVESRFGRIDEKHSVRLCQ
jgi:NAD(P)-dependent dehydrogenase (short-subunit alcohol dehydrogenase family)